MLNIYPEGTVDLNSKKNVALPLMSACILILFSTSIVTQLSASGTTTFYVHPSTSTVAVGQTFVIHIKISAVNDLYGWEFKLGWDPNLLDAVDVTEGLFLKQSNDTFFTKKINNAEGYILADCTLLGNVPGVSGDGTLAYVEFYAKNEGTSALDLYDTKLVNSLEQSITHTANDGNVTVSRSVGGIIIPVSKLELLAPWIGLTSTIIIAMTAIAVFVKRRKKKK